MQIIKEMSKQIEAEIHDADEYIHSALRLKDEHPDIAAMYYKLSEDELGHVSKLHDSVAGQIREYRNKHGEPPAAMLAVYNYLHDKHIEDAAAVKSAQDLYRR